jgi:hypothetical protein
LRLYFRFVIANYGEEKFFSVICFPALQMHEHALLEFCNYSDCIGSPTRP